jgi:hypothetical protein
MDPRKPITPPIDGLLTPSPLSGRKRVAQQGCYHSPSKCLSSALLSRTHANLKALAKATPQQQSHRRHATCYSSTAKFSLRNTYTGWLLLQSVSVPGLLNACILSSPQPGAPSTQSRACRRHYCAGCIRDERQNAHYPCRHNRT